MTKLRYLFAFAALAIGASATPASANSFLACAATITPASPCPM